MPAVLLDRRDHRPRRHRLVARATGLMLLAVLVLAASGSAAWADDSGEVTGGSLSNWGILLRLLWPTLAGIVIISGLAALPRLLRRPRYRPGKPWSHDPLWFAGAENPERALAGVRPVRRSGGASADW